MEQFADYFDHMDRWGSQIGEHYGFGVGFDRVVQYLMGATDIRQSAGFLVDMGGDNLADHLSGNGHEPTLADVVLQGV